MPDIRSFFGPKGGGPAVAPVKPKPAPAPAKKTTRKRRNVVSDDEEEEEAPPPKKVTPKKTPAKPAKNEERIEPSAYFAKTEKEKVTRSASKPLPKRDIVMKKNADEDNFLDDDDDDFGDDIFKSEYGKAVEEEPKKRSRKKTKREESSAEEDEDEEMDDFIDDEDDEVVVQKKPTRSTKPVANGKADKPPPAKKRKSVTPDMLEEEEAPASRKKATPKKPRAPRKEKTPEPETKEMQAIFDSVPTVRAPTPPPRDPTKKFNFRDFKQNAPPPPPNQGAADIPVGAENCLVGLTFVFTGVLNSLAREDGIALVQKYGAKVTTGPSKKTSFVVLGADAGPKKLETIRNLSIKTIDEEGLFSLIRKLPAHGGDGKAAQEMAKKKEEEQKKIIKAAKELVPNTTAATGKKDSKDASAQLWTVKYAPTQMRDIIGNKAPVERLQNWLKNWPRNHRLKFKLHGADGSGGYRAVMIHGPPGIGKTTAAHLVAKTEGYDIVESNASDTRSKKLLEASVRGVLDNRSLLGYFAEGKEKVDQGKQKIILIMDEVDGMSAGDRGGVGQLAALCRKTNIPIICICNDRKLPKMKPFDHATFDIPFRRPDTTAVRTRMSTIAYREGLKIPGNVLDQLTEGSHSDIRQIINMLSTFKTTQSSMDFDQGKKMAAQWEKHVVLKPWDIAGKLLHGGMFAASNKKTLNDKIELYFNDHEFSYLMIQDNYLKPNPRDASTLSGKQRAMKLLQLADQAAESISDGDLVDALIHGPQQQWSMMPVHAVFSTVRPSYFMSGAFSGGHMGFTAWLGNNSKQQKLTRMVKEIQSHMRLRSSADRHAIRQHYVPMFYTSLAKKLEVEGKEALDSIIGTMDDYYLTKEDWDAIVELGVGPNDAESYLKIDSATKGAFTRKYNAMSHPLPFMKASSVLAPKKGAKKEQPDLEEAIEESDDEAALLDDAENAAADADEEDMDITKDKYVKQPKKKAAPKGKGKGKAGAAADDDDVEEKPKATKGKAKTAGAAKGKAKAKK